ncbi:MAG: LCCL domain-containing protein [Pyrinomonadaceae bacterium]
MEKQKLFTTSTNKAVTIFRPVIFSLALALGLIFGMMQPVFAQPKPPGKITVAVDQTKTRLLKRPANANFILRVSPAKGIANVTFNATTGRISIRGLAEGVATITLTGTYRAAGNAGGGNGGGGMVGGVQGKAESFRFDWDLTVEPKGSAPVADPNAGKFPVQVDQGKNQVLGIERILGQEFANTRENGVSWRRVKLTTSRNPRIAQGELFDTDQLKLRVRGVSAGDTTLVLEGETLKDDQWQLITRTIEVTVASAGADPYLDGLERRLDALKNSAAQARDSETRLARAIADLETFRGLVVRTTNANTDRARSPRLSSLYSETIAEKKRAEARFEELTKLVRTITWQNRLVDLDLSLVKNRIRTFSCPANPQKIYSSDIYGTLSYLNISPFCGAAVHAGVITFGGGNITVEFRPGGGPDVEYVGSKRNDVTSNSWKRNWGGFVFR